jgi:hypothetical protein
VRAKERGDDHRNHGSVDAYLFKISFRLRTALTWGPGRFRPGLSFCRIISSARAFVIPSRLSGRTSYLVTRHQVRRGIAVGETLRSEPDWHCLSLLTMTTLIVRGEHPRPEPSRDFLV